MGCHSRQSLFKRRYHWAKMANRNGTLCAFSYRRKALVAKPYVADAIVSGLAGRGNGIFIVGTTANINSDNAAPALTLAVSAVFKSGQWLNISKACAIHTISRSPRRCVGSSPLCSNGPPRAPSSPKTPRGQLVAGNDPGSSRRRACCCCRCRAPRPEGRAGRPASPAFLKWPGKPGPREGVRRHRRAAHAGNRRVLFDKGRTTFATILRRLSTRRAGRGHGPALAPQLALFRNTCSATSASLRPRIRPQRQGKGRPVHAAAARAG